MRIPSWAMLVVVIVGFAASAGAAVFTYTNVRQIVLESPVELPAPPQIGNVARPTPEPALITATQPPSVATNASNVSVATAPVIDRITDPSRITILLLGTDHRPGETDPPRTDTIMVLSIDPIRKTAVMLSIPRDIYLKIPGYGQNRINTAVDIGNTQQYPGGGPALALKTVQSLVGIPIQHYVLIDFDVFTTAINAVGPIKVCPTEDIHDDKYPDNNYGFITVDFKAGCQDLDATRLLQYSRVRHNAGDDFGRAKRQQEVIKAVRDKVLSLGGLSALFGQVGELWNAVRNNLKTDMTLTEMLQIAQAAQDIPKDQIRSEVLTIKTKDSGQLIPTTLSNGDQVLTPVYEDIHNLIALLFDATPGGSSIDPRASGATLVVSNGAGIDGLAKSTADKLKALGFNVVDFRNADQPGGYGQTVIRVYNAAKMENARFLADTIKVDRTVITIAQNGPAGVDIELVIGKDLKFATG